MSASFNRLAPYGLLAGFCLASLVLRPLIPADETRYLTVAWEMFQRGHVFVPTLNFLPYHHKPPLLFWLIESSWALVGVSRAAAMLVVFAISSLCLALTRRVALALFPGRADIAVRVEWTMLASVVFLIYSTLILFDLLLTCCVLAAFLALLSLSRTGRLRDAVLFGLFVGLGVLAKGPVVLIHALWPVVLYPLWREPHALPTGAFLRRLAPALLAALVPPALWLGPVLLQADDTFSRSLLWDQSAGRISGKMEASHPRPFYFYLTLLPVLLLPWLLSPHVWREIARLRRAGQRAMPEGERRALRLLVLWAAGIVATFSLISGKQPHYVVPVLPLVSVGFAALLAGAPVAALRRTAAVLVLLFTLFQVGASWLFFPRYDLSPVAAFLAARPEAEIGFVGFYQGELNFLARLEKPVQIVAPEFAGTWLAAHPGGLLVDFHDAGDEPPGQTVLRIAYRDGWASILRQP